MNPGYIPIPRALFDDPIWLEKRTFSKAEALADLYRRAAYLPHAKYVDGKLVEVGIGEVVDSLRYLANAWAWGKTSVHEFLKRLEKAGQLNLKTRTGITVITLTFSATYYSESAAERTANGHAADSKRTPSGHRADKREEDKEDKEDKGVETHGCASLPAPPVLPQTIEFDLMKRIGKPAAQIWTETNAAETMFGEKTPLALEWMEVRSRMGKPIVTHQEFTALSNLYAKHTKADIKALIEYSAGKYPDLYPDRLTRLSSPKGTSNRQSLDPNDLETSRKQAKTTPSGVKML